MDMNCDELYKTVVSGSGGRDYILFDLAQCFMSGYDEEKLRSMLQSSDLGVVDDGLFIVGEIGGLARKYVRDVAVLASSEDPEVKRKATYLINIYGAGQP
jgi:hypothetical protein